MIGRSRRVSEVVKKVTEPMAEELSLTLIEINEVKLVVLNCNSVRALLLTLLGPLFSP